MSATFRIFIAGTSSNSRAAITNLNRALVSLDRRPNDVEIVDVFERPDLAADARVLVTPTLLRLADPNSRIVGDLSASGYLMDFLKLR